LISNPTRWAKTLMIVTYDEHGGFFDHVPPHEVETKIGSVTFTTAGPRVPALLISPHVGERQVFSEPLDHTSILQAIAERFSLDGKYSDAVATRQRRFGRIANALRAEPRTEIPKPPPVAAHPLATAAEAAAAPARPHAPETPNAAAIDEVAREMAKQHPEWMNMPGWREMKEYLATNKPPVPRRHGHIN
jgi:phospholipase C